MRTILKYLAIFMVSCMPLHGQQDDSALLKELEQSSRKWTRLDWKHEGQFIEFGSSFTLNKEAIELISHNKKHLQVDLRSGRRFRITTSDSFLSPSIIHQILSDVLVEGQRIVLSGPDDQELKLYNLMERLSDGEQTRENRITLLKAILLHSKTLHWSDVSRWLQVTEIRKGEQDGAGNPLPVE